MGINIITAIHCQQPLIVQPLITDYDKSTVLVITAYYVSKTSNRIFSLCSPVAVTGDVVTETLKS